MFNWVKEINRKGENKRTSLLFELTEGTPMHTICAELIHELELIEEALREKSI